MVEKYACPKKKAGAVSAPPADETQALTKGGVIDEEEMEIEMQSQPPAQRGTPGYAKAPR